MTSESPYSNDPPNPLILKRKEWPNMTDICAEDAVQPLDFKEETDSP